MPSVHPSKSSADPTDTILVTDASGNIFNVPASALGGQSTGGYVAPPVYSNSSGEAGQYSWDADYFYICIAEDSWDRFPVSREGWNTMIPENPTILSLAINDDGDVLTIVFDRVVSMGSAYQNSDINLDASSTGDDIGVSYVSGSGSSTWVFSISEAIRGGEAVNLDYNGRPDGIEDDVGGDLQAISSREVENGSLSGYSDIILWDGFEGAITGSSYESTNYDYPSFHAYNTTAYCSISQAINAVGGGSLRINGSAYVLDGEIHELSAFKGRLGLWVRLDTDIYGGFHAALRLQSASDANSLSMTFVNGTQLIIGVTNNGETLVSPAAFTPYYEIAANAWFFIELAWDFENIGLQVIINGDGDNATIIPKISDAPINYTMLRLGVSNFYGYVDNLIISSDPDRDLYALALLETCPRTE